MGDASTAEREAHSLKGVASTLGATALAEQAAKVETAIKTGQNVDEAIESLSRSLVAVMEAIQSTLARLGGYDAVSSTPLTEVL